MATFDAPSGRLTLTIDEEVIDGVEFEGVDGRVARVFADEFARRSGDVFNRTRALQALDALLRQTRGASRPRHRSATPCSDGRGKRTRSARSAVSCSARRCS